MQEKETSINHEITKWVKNKPEEPLIEDIKLDFNKIILKDLISPHREKILSWISEWIIWQENAKNEIADFIIQSLTKIWKWNWTMGNMFFHWPTWVGKTQIIHTLSEFLLWDPNWFIKINCSEFGDSYSDTRLFWAPPWLVWYNNPPILDNEQLRKPFLKAVEKWKLNPVLNNLAWFSIILFDEIEKAHYKVVQSLLWALDNWKIEPSNTTFETVDLSNTIIIFTSNVWEHLLDIKKEEKTMWFKTKDIDNNTDNWDKLLNEEIKNNFSPEFRWRIDSFVKFEKLNKNEVIKIIYKLKNSFEKDISSYYINYPKININFTDTFFEYLFENYHNDSKWIRELERNFNLNIRRKIELLLTIEEFSNKYNNKRWIIDLNFKIEWDEISFSITDTWIHERKNIVKESIITTHSNIESILECDFEIFKELWDINYLNFDQTKNHSDISFIDIYSKKYLVNEKNFNNKLEEVYKTYQTIKWVYFEYLQKINLNLGVLRKMTWKIVNNYLENSDLNISLDLYTYLNLVSIIKPICLNKWIDFNKVNNEILVYFATRWN